MQKLIIVKKKFMNINIKNIFIIFFKKQKHLKSLSQIFFFSFTIMHNVKQIIMCIKFAK